VQKFDGYTLYPFFRAVKVEEQTEMAAPGAAVVLSEMYRGADGNSVWAPVSSYSTGMQTNFNSFVSTPGSMGSTVTVSSAAGNGMGHVTQDYMLVKQDGHHVVAQLPAGISLQNHLPNGVVLVKVNLTHEPLFELDI
jgi:hypothetical protein